VFVILFTDSLSISVYKQKECQSLDEFVIELRKLAKTCKFANVDNEILSQVIPNCKSNRLRRRALREPDMTLNDIVTLCLVERLG
jgi:hypothetical protein